MGNFGDVWRMVASRTLAVNSGGGAVTSTASLSAQTYAVDLVYAAEVGAPAAIRFDITDAAGAGISSLSAPLLPAGQVLRYKCSPGQKVQAISNGASVVASLTIIELSK
jgi:hypothetical protein